MAVLKKSTLLLVCLAISIFCITSLDGSHLQSLDTFNTIICDLFFVFILNFLAVHCVMNSLNNISVLLFAVLLFCFSWLFTFAWLGSPVTTFLRYFLMFYFSVILVMFYLSIFENLKMKSTWKFVFIQALISTICFIFYGNLTEQINAILFFISILSSVIICIQISCHHINDQPSKRILTMILIGVLASVLPYMLFTFVPKFLFPGLKLPVFGNWTLYFLLILPVIISVILYKKNLTSEQIGAFRYPLNLLILTIEITTADIIVFYVFLADILVIILTNYLFLVIYIINYLLSWIQIKKRQSKVAHALDNLQDEKVAVFKQLLANDQLEKMGFWILNFLKKNMSFSGGAVTLSKNNNSEFFIARYGDLNDLSISFLQKGKELVYQSKPFEYKNVKCMYFPLNHLNQRIGGIILSRDTFSAFSPDEVEILNNYVHTFSEMLFSSIWMVENERSRSTDHFTAEERLVYLKTADLAIRDKKRLSEFLHDEILQKIFGVKNLVTTLNGSLETKSLITKTLDEVNQSLRAQMTELYPAFLNVTSIESSIENLIIKNNLLYGKNIKLNLSLEQDIPINQEQKHMIFRMVKELVTNTYKHATNASEVKITLYRDSDWLKIIVQDDGDSTNSSIPIIVDVLQDHLGLASIKQEVTFLNGTFDITNSGNRGFRINLTIPIFDSEQR